MHNIVLIIPAAIIVVGLLEWWLAVRKPPRRWR
jgi:hypothetical protein